MDSRSSPRLCDRAGTCRAGAAPRRGLDDVVPAITRGDSQDQRRPPSERLSIPFGPWVSKVDSSEPSPPVIAGDTRELTDSRRVKSFERLLSGVKNVSRITFDTLSAK